MDRLQTIQRIAAILRYALIAIAIILGGAIIMAMFTPAQDWVTFGDGRIAELWRNEAGNKALMITVLSPVAIALVLGVYWLQRLFGEYQAGRFFTDGNMRCYLWLVWLKVFSFIYGAIWPALLANLAATGSDAEVSISIRAGGLLELIVLLLIVHLLKEAQQINDENKAIV